MENFDLAKLLAGQNIVPIETKTKYINEVYVSVDAADFKNTCESLHKALRSPVMSMFAVDELKDKSSFAINCVFFGQGTRTWYFISTAAKDNSYPTIAYSIYSASLFEREIKEMFGLDPIGSPDVRRLKLHDEVWPQGLYPMRKDFNIASTGEKGEYAFVRIEGEGIFEIPVGPVHAGIIGSGHFRFSAAGEPIINLETRLGFTHKGTEKIMEGLDVGSALKLSECVAGDSAFSHSLAFASSIEKIYGINIPRRAMFLRAIFLELERLYNHAADIGTMALDVGFSYPAAVTSIMKEDLQALNDELSGSRFLKNINRIGGTRIDLDKGQIETLTKKLRSVKNDFSVLKDILLSSVSFLDRIEETGILTRRTAEDYGVIGLVGRASGIKLDLRKFFYNIYEETGFKMMGQEKGDVLARLNIRIDEFEESLRLINAFMDKMPDTEHLMENFNIKEGYALGAVEGWRGPILYWAKINSEGLIDRCKIVDPSFHNWTGISAAVLKNIVPDFPVINKSFNLSYSGNDL